MSVAPLPPSRSQLLRTAADTSCWDVVIIGGGATGLGLAVDAASRGHRTLLLEGHDFAKGTSSRSTKLVHGGVRYLAQGNISLVREALRERGLLARNAPHLVKAVGFLIPSYGLVAGPYYRAGLSFYDWLSGDLSMGRTRSLTRAEALAESPGLAPSLQGRPLRGGTLYYDGQFDDARLAVSLMRTAFREGATLLNYCAVTAIAAGASPARFQLTVRDEETGDAFTVQTGCLINATGVWVDAVRRMVNPGASALVAPSQGSHVTVAGTFLPGRHAIMVPKTDDGRVMFVVPWHDHAIIGTTDSPRSDQPFEPRPSASDLDFILRTAARYLATPPQPSDVLSTWAGLRPLVRRGATSRTASLSREHTIDFDAQGMITVTGGKWTTYRYMAEQVLDLAATHGQIRAAKCVTAELRVHGADAEDAAEKATCGDVAYAARAEMARTVEDVLARRSRLLFLNAAAAVAAAPKVAQQLSAELDRPPGWAQAQVETFTLLAKSWLQPG